MAAVGAEASQAGVLRHSTAQASCTPVAEAVGSNTQSVQLGAAAQDAHKSICACTQQHL